MSVSREFTGGPASAPDRIKSLLTPHGGAVTDGARLAAINTIGIVVALVVVTLVSLLARVLDRLLPIPVLVVSFITLLVLIAFGIFVSYRYANEYGNAARARRHDVRPDLFGAVGAIPFAAIAVILLLFGLFGLFFAVITISGDRAIDALQRMGFGLVFLLLAGATIVTSRAASDSDGKFP